MFKNRTAHIKISKDIPSGDIQRTDYVTALNATEAAANRILDNVVKAACTIIVVSTLSKILVKAF